MRFAFADLPARAGIPFGLLPIARALREQIDWSDVRRRTADRPIAVGFLALAEALGIAPGQRELRAVPEEPRIRVTTT